MDLSPGHQLERYSVDSLIGVGGMARVYRVRHARLGSWHAMKLLQVPIPAVVDRLLQEGRAQSALRHPNIVPVTDIVDVDGVPGLVMEWVDGPSLSQLLAGHKLTLPQVDALAAGLFDGVIAAHRAGLVHRDLKPGNVLLQLTHDRVVPRITDFGLVKALSGESLGEAMTRTGAMMGTPAYMAPEQLLDASAVDARADIFALGAILYELLSGERAFTGADTWELLGRIREGRYVPLEERCPGLPQEVLDAVSAALAASPQDRPETTEALARRWGSRSLPSSPWTEDELALLRDLTVRSAEPAAPEATAATGSMLFGAPATVSPASPASGSATTFAPLDSVSWSRGDAPVDEVPAAEPPETAEAAPLESRRARPVALAGVIGLVAVAAGLAAWSGLLGEAPPAALTAAGAPALIDDVRLQGQLEQGWQAALRGDRTEAIRKLELVTERAPEVALPWLLLSYIYLRDGQLAEALDRSSEAIRLGEEESGPTGSLVRMVHAQQRSSQVMVPELDEHLAAWPEDLLGVLMDADYCYVGGFERCEVATARLLAQAPEAALAHRVTAEAWSELNDRERQLAALDRGLEVAPRDPQLLLSQATALLNSGDHEGAQRSLAASIQADPQAVPPRLLRARLAVLEGESETLAALRAELTSASQPLEVRLSFYESVSDTLRGLGRLSEADAELAVAEALEADEGSTTGRIDLLSYRISLAYLRQDWEEVLVLAKRATTLAAQNSDVPSPLRDRVADFYQYHLGRAALAGGDLEGARAVLERLSAARTSPQANVETLTRELAIAEGDVAVVQAMDEHFWQTRCVQRVSFGDALHRAGDAPGALGAYREVLEAGCRTHTSERAALVAALVGMAELGAPGGLDAEARALWTAPDPAHPLAVRLAALE